MGTFPARSLPDLRQLSLSAWVILDASPTIAQFIATAQIVDNRGWSLANTASNELTWEVGRDSGNYYSVTTDSAVGSSLTHIAITWNGGFSSGDTIIYVNGSPVAATTTAGSGNHLYGQDLTFILLAGFEAFSVGWMGIWDRALAAAEVAQLAARRSPLFFPNALTAYWPMLNTTQERDRVGNNELFVDFTGVPPVFALVDLQIDDPHPGWQWAGFGAAAPEGATINAPLGLQAYTGLLPGVQTGTSVAVPLGVHAYTGLLPEIQTGIAVAVPPGVHAYTGILPTVSTGVNVAAPAGIHTYQGFLPTVTTGSVYEQVSFRFRNDDGGLGLPG